MQAILDLDRAIVVALNGYLHSHPLLSSVVKFIALYGVYIFPILAVGWWLGAGRKTREYMLSAVLSGLLAWQVFNTGIKLLIDRNRPDESLPVQELLFRRPDTSFPSDHAALLFGVAFFFWLNKERQTSGWLFLLAVMVGVARVATAVHYPTDILVGCLDGFLGAVVVSNFHRFLSEIIWTRVIALARKLKLA